MFGTCGEVVKDVAVLEDRVPYVDTVLATTAPGVPTKDRTGVFVEAAADIAIGEDDCALVGTFREAVALDGYDDVSGVEATDEDEVAAVCEVCVVAAAVVCFGPTTDDAAKPPCPWRGRSGDEALRDSAFLLEGGVSIGGPVSSLAVI